MTGQAAERAYSARFLAGVLGNPPPTEEQRRIIEAPLRPLLVVAGAGSGKTETMASRVVWLVANGWVQPDQVLGLTFTRKAATELAERVGRRLRRLRSAGLWTPEPEDDGAEVLGGTPTVSTYHSYAGRLVHEHALRVGVEPESRLLSEAAAWQFASEVVERYDGPLDQIRMPGGGGPPALATVVAAVADLAGEMAEHLVDASAIERFVDEFEAVVTSLPWGTGARQLPSAVGDALGALRARRTVLPLVRDYLALKRSRDALDFSDQMALAARLASEFPDIGEIERKRFGAVLLDEFQDTSEAQLVLLRELFVRGAQTVPVTAVGDPHQSIYGWRGASADTLARFPSQFADPAADADVLPLSTSWRNDRTILDAANRTAAPLTERTPVDVEVLRPRPEAGGGEMLTARLQTVEDEAATVASWLARHWERDRAAREHDPQLAPLTAAVLCRKRAQFPLLVEALEAAGLPVEVVGLGGLLTTPEVSDIVATLWVVQDPTRGDHLMRLLLGPLCRFGSADLEGLAAWSSVLGFRRRRPSSPDADGASSHGSGVPVKDHAPDSADRSSIVEALDELPSAAWRGADGQRISAEGLERLGRLADVVRGLRSLTGLPLVDVVGEAERALGLDIEVLARRGHTPATARAHLDAFADVASTFSTSADRPTLGGFLSWLDAAQAEERGLDKGYIEVSDAAVQILTVHAAKGLEWDVVAVPGLVEGGFPSRPYGVTTYHDGSKWRLHDVKDRGWCGGLAGVPYDLRGDREGLPELSWRDAADGKELADRIADFALQGGRHAVDEERRLAYVAFTRARHELLLTAPVWADPTTPRVTSPFLEELVGDPAPGPTPMHWAPMPDADAENPRSVTPVQVSWPVVPDPARLADLETAARAVQSVLERSGGVARNGRGSGGRGVVEAATLPLGLTELGGRDVDAEIELLLAERDRSVAQEPGGDGGTVTVPRHLSASSVVALARDPASFALDLRRPMPSAPALAARRGTAFHAWVEQHYARAALVDITELPGSADPDPGMDDDLPLMKQIFLASEWAGRTPQAIEIAIETVVDGMSVRGRIDAVFPRPDGGFTVVDWKTGAKPSATEAKSRAMQLAAYRLAYARLRGVPLSAVDAAFYYAATGETVWPDLPGEAALRSVLGRHTCGLSANDVAAR